MSSTIIFLARLLISVFMIAQVYGNYGSAPTNDVYNFLTVLNGFYDTKEQATKPGSLHDLIEIIWQPLDAPALHPAITQFVAETANGKVMRYYLFAVSADSDGTAIFSIFNITKPSFYENRLLNITAAEVTSLELTDLEPIEDCIIDFYSGESELSINVRQRCRENGSPRYVAILYCDYYIAYFPPTAIETPVPDVPYDHKRKGERYPVPGIPDDFSNVCYQRK